MARQKLPKHLIKKYGISKKAWQVFRAGKKKKSKSRSVSTMAKKKTVTKRKKSGLMGNALIMSGVGALGYGALRERVSMALSPYTQRIPLGNISDEVAMGAISYLMAKGKIPLLNKVPLSREIGKAGFIIETARIGEAIANGTAWGSGTGVPSTPNGGMLF